MALSMENYQTDLVLSLPGDMGVFAGTTWKRSKTVFLEYGKTEEQI